MSKQQFPSVEEPKQNSKKRADAFWNIFLPVKNGKVKSTLVVYSFTLSVLFLAVYAYAYLLLIEPLHDTFSTHMPVWLSNFFGSIIPALIGTALCCSCHFLFKEKRLIPAAYVWLTIYALIVIGFFVFTTTGEELALVFSFLMLVIPAPLLSGMGISTYLYRRYRKKEDAKPVYEEIPPWKRNRTGA